uniref:Solute carrier family 1 member 3 n=1 Tax=Homo sapiens TaxID=9606 RepID=A0A7P0T8T4_HUMAN
MTKSNGEEPKMGGRMERFQQGVRKRTLLAKKKVQNITKEDVKSYLFRNAFVLLTVTAVIVDIEETEQAISNFSFKYNPWIYPPTIQNELPGSQVLLLSWGTSDEDVTDAGLTTYHLQSCHRNGGAR